MSSPWQGAGAWWSGPVSPGGLYGRNHGRHARQRCWCRVSSRRPAPRAYLPRRPDVATSTEDSGASSPRRRQGMLQVPRNPALVHRRCQRGNPWTGVQHHRLETVQSMLYLCLLLSSVSRRRRSVSSLSIGTPNGRDAPVARLGSPHALTRG